MYLPITSPSHPGLAVFISVAGQIFQEIFPPQSYAKSVAAIRLSSCACCSWVKRTGLEMWAVNLGVTIHLARAHHPCWKKTLVKVTNKQLLGKSSSSTKASVLGYAKSSSSPTAANHSVFLHCSSVCHLQRLLMCNYIQPRGPGLLCVVIQLSGMIRISCLRISSIHVRQTLNRALPLWRRRVEERCGSIIPHQTDKFPSTYLKFFQFLF